MSLYTKVKVGNEWAGMFGAYITDPLKFVDLVCPESNGRMAVGCDCGGGVTKIGVTLRIYKLLSIPCLPRER